MVSRINAIEPRPDLVFLLPHLVLAATRYDSDNFWLVEFDPANRSHRVLETGDCG